MHHHSNDLWGGSGLAGITIRLCTFDYVNEHVWHVLYVYPNAPAALGGLENHTDYIVGTPDLLFNDSEDFFTLINGNEGKVVPIYVYSTLTDNVRIVNITPKRGWGGTGLLGCDVGYGYLHKIPQGYVQSQNQSPSRLVTLPASSQGITTLLTSPNSNPPPQVVQQTLESQVQSETTTTQLTAPSQPSHEQLT